MGTHREFHLRKTVHLDLEKFHARAQLGCFAQALRAGLHRSASNIDERALQLSELTGVLVVPSQALGLHAGGLILPVSVQDGSDASALVCGRLGGSFDSQRRRYSNTFARD